MMFCSVKPLIFLGVQCYLKYWSCNTAYSGCDCWYILNNRLGGIAAVSLWSRHVPMWLLPL